MIRSGLLYCYDTKSSNRKSSEGREPHTSDSIVYINYVQALVHEPYRLANKSSKYEYGFMIKCPSDPKSQSYMKVHFFDRKDPMSIIGSSATFTLVCDAYCIHEGAAIWVIPYYVNVTLVNALNSRTSGKNKSTPLITSVRNKDVSS